MLSLTRSLAHACTHSDKTQPFTLLLSLSSSLSSPSLYPSYHSISSFSLYCFFTTSILHPSYSPLLSFINLT